MMNPRRLAALLVLGSVQLVAMGTLRADDTPPAKSTEKLPVNVCIVSGEHLLPGEIVTYVHKAPGQPDRTVRLCCRKCLARFKADPDRYLKKLDQLESDEKNTRQAD
jgi:hypothetical protein